MYELAGPVRHWLSEGRVVWLVRLIETRGFSSRVRAPIVAVTTGQAPLGELLSSVADERLFAELFDQLRSAPSEDSGRIFEVAVTDERAVGAGLSCGGVARLLVELASEYPPAVWTLLEHRDPLCLVTEIEGERGGPTVVLDHDTVAAARERYRFDLARLFARGISERSVIEADDRDRPGPTVVQLLWPVPCLVIVGGGLIAAALSDFADRMGWRSRVVADGDPADIPTVQALQPDRTVQTLAESDGLVVLSHDRAVDGPALLAALGSRVGYVAGLGSRRTQAARAAWLTEHGASSEQIARIHGPAGLDIGAYTAEEIAISIIAEMVSVRSAAAGGSLTARSGPIHTSGVSAPPSR